MPESEQPPDREPGQRSPAGRLVGLGARGAERIAGLTGVDRVAQEALEESIVRALRSPAVEGALVRLVEQNAVQDAIQRALTTDEVVEAIVEALDSQLADRVWTELLASDKAQMLVERIAEAPEVRAAIAEQGVGLVTDVGRRLTKITEALDDSAERIAHRLVGRSGAETETNEVGLFSRALAFAVDVGVLALLVSLGSRLLDAVIPGGLHPSAVLTLLAIGVAAGAYFVNLWALIGQTPGMRFLSIRLSVDGDSNEIGLWRALLRVVGLVASIVPLAAGVLAILFSTTRRGWHDYLAGTRVVYERRNEVAPWSRVGGEQRADSLPAG